MNSLENWGWTEALEAGFRPFAESAWTPARVLVEHRDLYRVMTRSGEVPARVSGRFRFTHPGVEEAPAVGDWTAVELSPQSDTAVIHAVLPRRTAIVRKEAGERSRGQVLAANVDTAMIVTSANQEFNARRLERFLTLIYESGAAPVVLLNKADLCEDIDAWLSEAALAAPGVSVHCISALNGDGMEALGAYCREGQTVVLLGSSGVGKSTLTNRLVGAEALVVRPIREDDARGRHTTSHRQLFSLVSGGLIIDTPGLREVGLWSATGGVVEAFADIEALAADCRFRDCRHEGEPGCAIRAGVESGTLDPSRERGYRKLRRELEYVEGQQDQQKRQDTKKRWKAITRQIRAYKKK